MTASRSSCDLAQRLILRAAHQTPSALSERLQEEWLADLQYRSGAVSRLRLAIGCCWATGVIARDFGAPKFAISGPAAWRIGLRNGLPILSRRALGFLLVVGVHGLLLYGIRFGIMWNLDMYIPTPIHVSVPDESLPANDSRGLSRTAAY